MHTLALTLTLAVVIIAAVVLLNKLSKFRIYDTSEQVVISKADLKGYQIMHKALFGLVKAIESEVEPSKVIEIKNYMKKTA